MNNEDFTQNYNLTRKEASIFLGVCIRTLDRYIKSKKLSMRMVNGRILLNEIELEAFKREKNILGGKYVMKTEEAPKNENKKEREDVEIGNIDNVDKQVDNIDKRETSAKVLDDRNEQNKINIISNF